MTINNITLICYINMFLFLFLWDYNYKTIQVRKAHNIKLPVLRFKYVMLTYKHIDRLRTHAMIKY